MVRRDAGCGRGEMGRGRCRAGIAGSSARRRGRVLRSLRTGPRGYLRGTANTKRGASDMCARRAPDAAASAPEAAASATQAAASAPETAASATQAAVPTTGAAASTAEAAASATDAAARVTRPSAHARPDTDAPFPAQGHRSLTVPTPTPPRSPVGGAFAAGRLGPDAYNHSAGERKKQIPIAIGLPAEAIGRLFAGLATS